MHCAVYSELLQVRNSGRMNKVEQDVTRVEEEVGAVREEQGKMDKEVEGVREEHGRLGEEVEGVREEQERLGRVTAQQLREVTDTTGERHTISTLEAH